MQPALKHCVFSRKENFLELLLGIFYLKTIKLVETKLVLLNSLNLLVKMNELEVLYCFVRSDATHGEFADINNAFF